MTTKLEKPVRREINVDDRLYTLTIDPAGLKLVEKGHRKGREMRWQDLINDQSDVASTLPGGMPGVPLN